jgi:hypothetical protein
MDNHLRYLCGRHRYRLCRRSGQRRRFPRLTQRYGRRHLFYSSGPFNDVHQVGTAEQATKDWDGRYVQSRAPHEDERKPVAHCEPVGSSLAGPAILYMAPRLCFA